MKKIGTYIKFLLLLIVFFSSIKIGTVLAENQVIMLDQVSIDSKSNDVVASITSFDNYSLNSNATFYKLNDYVVYKLTIKNTDSKSYTIQSITDNNTNEAIKYIYADSINKVIDAKASLDVLVKVSYVSAVDDITNRSQLDNTRLSFVLSSEDGEVKGDVEVNPTPGPKTGDTIYFYIALSSISLIGLIVLVKVPKKKTYMVLLLLITPIIVKALSITFITSFNNNIQFLDKLVVKINNNGTVTQQTINYKSTISEPIPTEKDGYNFIGWFSGNTEFDFSAPITGDVNIEGKYEIIPYTITYELNGGNADTVSTYNVETETITLPQPTKQGYDFTGWTGSNGDTPELTVTIDKGSTGDKSYAANYTARTDTPYTVVHRYELLNGGYDEVESPETGTTDTYVTPSVVSKTGYDDPDTQTVKVGATGDTVITYEYKLKRLSLTISDRTYLTNTSSANGTYKYGETITLEAVERTDYLFKWSDDDTNYQKSFVITANTQLSLVYTYNKYVVTFNAKNGTCTEAQRFITKGSAIGNLPTCTPPQYYEFIEWQDENDNKITSSYIPTDDVELKAVYRSTDMVITFDTLGGSAVSVVVLHQGDAIGTLPTTTKDGKVFAGWYIDTNYNAEDKITAEYQPTESMTVYAKWNDYICIKATSLHSDTCSGTNTSQGCRNAGMSVGQEYTFGSIVSANNLAVGDALDCDLDGNGYNTRFYYLYTKDGNAVLIAYNNYENNGGRKFGSTQNYNYSAKDTYIPNATEWTNLPVTFGDKAARIIEIDDLKTFTGKTEAELKTAKSLLPYLFLFENTSFNGNSSLKSTHWIMEWEENGTAVRGRIHKNTANVDMIATSSLNSSNNGVRPVIEIPTAYINDQYIVKYDAQGGTIANEYVRVTKGSSLGTLPTPTNGTNLFAGWYTSTTYETQIDASTVPIGYVTYYAKWVKSVEEATIQNNNFSIQEGTTDSIIITNASELEDYTLTSNDESVVTVSQDGTITAVSAGTTTITLRGLITNKTVTINVRVIVPSNDHTIAFDVQGGSDVANMYVPDGQTIGSVGSLPAPIKADYTFGGWFTNSSFTVEITEDTIVNDDIAAIAKWIPNDKSVEFNNNKFYDTIQQAIEDNPDETQLNIKLLKDVTISSGVVANLYTTYVDKDVVMDLNNHTITSTTSTDYIIRAKANLTIKNGTITCKSTSKAAVEINTGSLLIDNVRIIATGKRQAIYIENKPTENGSVSSELGAPVVEIRGNTYLEAKQDATRGTVQILSGTLNIKSGTILSKTDRAVYIAGGTVNIGTKNGTYDNTNPILKGNTYGVSGKTSSITYNVYDGTIMGKTAAVENESKITGKEEGAIKANNNDGDYQILYYELPITQYVINLNPNGGTLSSNTVLVDVGDAITNLPTPTKGIYTFDGWYDDDTNQLVTNATIPTGDMNLTARWSYTSSDDIQTFNLTNAVISKYYEKIEDWKGNESTFQTEMDNNFNAYNCKCNENTCNTAGTELCDKPLGYQVAEDDVTVYIADENTKEKIEEAKYVTVKDGLIYNMIPGVTYRWESNTDSNVYGYVKAEGKRRIIDVDGVRNVRDLGGLRVDLNNDNIPDGTLEYGRLFRGEKLWNSTNNVTQLSKLGVNEEVDLRAASERQNGEVKFNNFKQREIKHYQLNYTTQNANYQLARNTVIEVMQDIVEEKEIPNNIYFHCRIGTDRTGTLAYILEGLLGVMQEDMLEDYELSYFFGLVNRHRYYSIDPNSSVSTDQKFVYMYNIMPDANAVYEWFMQGSQNTEADAALVEAFRQAMIK